MPGTAVRGEVKPMEYGDVGGTRIPSIGLGTARLPARDCIDGVGHALAVGYRAIDTARRYGKDQAVLRRLDRERER